MTTEQLAERLLQNHAMGRPVQDYAMALAERTIAGSSAPSVRYDPRAEVLALEVMADGSGALGAAIELARRRLAGRIEG